MLVPDVFRWRKPRVRLPALHPDHAGLHVTDLDAASAWYTDTLDFRA
jgi:hypothetical protein